MKSKPAFLVSLFTLALLLTAACLHLLLPPSLRLYASVRSEKLALLQAHGRETTSAAFGSSHLHDGFDPREFDRILNQAGRPEHSFNLALEAGPQVEEFLMAKEFLQELRPATDSHQLRVVLLELNEGLDFGPDYLYESRAINIHDGQTVQFVFGATDGKWSSLGSRLFALWSGGLHFLNLGMLSDAIFQPPLRQDFIFNETVNDRRGLISSLATPRSEKEVADFFEHPPALVNTSAVTLSGASRYMLDRLVQEKNGNEVHFVYVVSPYLLNLSTRFDYPPFLDGPTGKVLIINLGRPDRYPALYQKELWRDSSHVNEKGATVLSGILATEIAHWFDHESPGKENHAVR